MATTRGSGSTSGQGRAPGDEPEAPLPQPPPPPAQGPDWNQMMTNQAQLINLLAQSITNTQNLQAAAAAQPPVYIPPPPRANILEFMRMRPPTFSSTTEPMEADDWLRVVSRKLDMIQFTNRERVLFASHQLHGPASEWWDNFTQSHVDAQTITWEEFVQAFRRAYIPHGQWRK